NWSPGTGYQALLSGKKAALVYASAGAYAAHTESASESPDDFQKPYLRRWLRFIGIEDVTEISAAPTLTTPDALAAAKANAKVRASALATA
ncbi:NAD(P)H-dependent oxidoreductase, partial [Acinetobacter baumannii]